MLSLSPSKQIDAIPAVRLAYCQIVTTIRCLGSPPSESYTSVTGKCASCCLIVRLPDCQTARLPGIRKPGLASTSKRQTSALTVGSLSDCQSVRD